MAPLLAINHSGCGRDREREKKIGGESEGREGSGNHRVEANNVDDFMEANIERDKRLREAKTIIPILLPSPDLPFSLENTLRGMRDARK
jgi:hypothetical protein